MCELGSAALLTGAMGHKQLLLAAHPSAVPRDLPGLRAL